MKGSCVFLLAGMLTACASPVIYYNPNITNDSDRNRQFTIDDGYCTQVSDGAVPMPEMRIYQPEQTNYSIHATTTAFNSRTGLTTYNTTGSINSYPTQSFATGFANGASIGAAMAANERRQRVYHGCMVNLGWTTDKNEKAKPKEVDLYADIPADAAYAIKNIPDLKLWFETNDPNFYIAAKIDKELSEQSEWKGVPLVVRFMEATIRTKKISDEIKGKK